MPSLRSWWAQRVERRVVRRQYRRALRGWVRPRVTSRLAPANLALSLLLGIGGVFVYWVWSRIWNTPFDPVGFWALVIPPTIYVAGTWAYYRTKAPAQVFEAQRRQLQQYNPPIPWVVAVEVAEEERRITVRLVLSDRHTGTTTIDSATCFFALEQVRPACTTPKSGNVGEGKSIQWDYPAEFSNPVWPLPDGQYEAVVSGITSSSIQGTASIGGQFRIGPRKRWLRR